MNKNFSKIINTIRTVHIHPILLVTLVMAYLTGPEDGWRGFGYRMIEWGLPLTIAFWIGVSEGERKT